MPQLQMQERGRGSSSDGFGTEKTSGSSFSQSPSASTDPLNMSPIQPLAVAQPAAHARGEMPYTLDAVPTAAAAGSVQSPSDYYTAASYRPPVACPARPVYNNNSGSMGMDTRDVSWTARLRATLCCGK
ncbi:hypothetical protein LPJ59_006617 [Coemansia sp. RSA 2399]|nr:hypothetical protein LPJ59_006617 [Coemansia sp. RSA 2399]KAJ1887226.1 hypothetical protein LPJ81_006557 [Coemansia sp. IMI 209127]